MITSETTQLPTILLVEDNPEDYEVALRTFRRANVTNPIQRCVDGEDALDYLYRRGAYGEDARSAPAIIMLDLNLPGTDGREVLAEIKSQARFRAIPVIVLTTSTDERDVRECYASGANSYVQKPVDLAGFSRTVEMLRDYWLDTVVLPHSCMRQELLS